MPGNKPAPRDKHIKVPRKVADQLFNEFEVGLARSLLIADPENVRAFHMLGSALTRAGRHEKALEVDLRLAQLTPKDPYVFYNLACSHSNLGNLDEGLAALSEAFKLGFRDTSHLMRDRDLEALRRDPRFKKLLDRKWGKRQP